MNVTFIKSIRGVDWVTNHIGATDRIIKIQLPSSLERVSWTKRMAASGACVGLEVFTHYVGNGSEIEIELSDQSGSKFGTYKEKISGNRYWAQIRIPAKARQALYATVKLPKHGLQMKSSPLIVLPPVEISNPKWGQKEAREGDIVTLSAEVRGVPDGTEGEIEIWEHNNDSAPDFITRFPAIVKDKKVEAEWEYVYHEDREKIPTHEELQEYGNQYYSPEYFFRVRVGEVAEESGLLEFKDWLEIQLKDEYGNPLAAEQYVLILADGQKREGNLDSNGYAKLENLPPGKCKIEFPNVEGMEVLS